jgi:hypothetical protein
MNPTAYVWRDVAGDSNGYSVLIIKINLPADTMEKWIAAHKLSHFLSSLLFSIGPHDPFAFASVTLVMS